MRVSALILVLLLALGATFRWGAVSDRADVVFANRGDVFTLDPQRMSYMQDFRLAYALYEPLVRWNNVDLSIESAAAELPEISEDLRTYIFRIKPGTKWSNGDPVTAHDFVYSFRRLLMPDTAADYSNFLFDIDGAADYFRWRGAQLAEFASRTGKLDARAVGNEHIAMYERAISRFNQTVGVRAMDDRTLRLTLARPVPYFLDLLCFAVAHPVHRPCVEGWPNAHQTIDAQRGWIGVSEPTWNDRRFVRIDPATGRLDQRHEWARPGVLVGNGPYVLTSWRYKRDLRLERNPNYHSPHIMRNASVLMRSIEDPNTAVLAFESGALDWIADVGAEYQADMIEQRERYVARHRALYESHRSAGMGIDEALAALPEPDSSRGERRDIHALPTFGTDFYSFNCREMLADGKENPFADARVRRAFALAIDKRAIVDTATRLGEPVAATLIPVGSIPGYVSPQGLGTDRPRARAELAEAGWSDRDGDGRIENELGTPFPVIDLLWTTSTTRYKWISLELKAQWERELGVHIELRGADTKFYKEDLKLGKFMIARGRWYGDYGDPTTFLDINRTGNGNNDRGFSNARFDELLDEAAAETDSTARYQLLARAEQLLVEEQLPLVPLCQLVQTYMYNPGQSGLLGLSDHPRLIQYFWLLSCRSKSVD